MTRTSRPRLRSGVPALAPRALLACGLLTCAAVARADTQIGSISCDRIEGTTRNFIVTSKADVRCIFKGDGDAEQWYVGETGIAIGLDLKWTKTENIQLAVISTTRDYAPEGDFMSGSYSGAKVDAAVGVGGGAALLIGGSDETTALQPAVSAGEGVGVSAGVGFLTLKPDALNVARVATLKGDAFTQALYSAYFSVALEDYRAARYEASDHFADKAVAAAAGQRPAPDRTEGRDLSADDLIALGRARERVVAAQRHEFAATAPGETAAVQAYYDCWLRAAAAPAHPARVDECRQYFDERMTALERHLGAQTAAAFTEDQLMKPRWWTVYFATDVSALDDTAEGVVADVVATIGNYNAARLYVWGHTDQVGSKAYNLELSKARADAVMASLVRGGVPRDWVRPTGYGEERPFRVSTNRRDATNRRVTIALEPLNVKVN